MDPVNPAQGGQGGAAQDPASQLQVDIPDEHKAGSYANAVSVTVNVNEVVLDFGYLLPNTQKPTILVVSRINTNLRTAKSFLNVLDGAIKDFEAKQAAQNAQNAQNTQNQAGMHPQGPAPMPPMGPAPMQNPQMPPQGPAPMPPMGPPPPPMDQGGAPLPNYA